MTKEESISILNRIISDYKAIADPKYRHADLERLEKDYALLMEMKEFHRGMPEYDNIVNAVSQTIAKMKAKDPGLWRNVSERGINKAIPPVIRKRGHVVEFPFEWADKDGHKCSISNGYWGARNYMVMDVAGYCLLLKEGENILPKDISPIFKGMEDISERETKTGTDPEIESHSIIDEQGVKRFQNTRYWIHFTDRDFRRMTSLNMNSNEIRDLLLETSRVEFKLVYPVRMWDKKMAKEQTYTMNCFSRLFEFGYIDKEVRVNDIVHGREYYISFNTMLGELFAHNLLSKNYDWIDTRFYSLPYNAQVVYRRFFVHNNYKSMPINLSTLVERLNLRDKNITNLVNTIERNIFEPLKELGYIKSFEKDGSGLYGLKFKITRSESTTQNDNAASEGQ